VELVELELEDELVVRVMLLVVADRLVAAEKALVEEALAVLEIEPLEEELALPELLELDELRPAVEASCAGTSLEAESLRPLRPQPLLLPPSCGEISATKFSAAVTPDSRSVLSKGADPTVAVGMTTARPAWAASSALRRCRYRTTETMVARISTTRRRSFHGPPRDGCGRKFGERGSFDA
jgi:hypothetical protein